MTPTDVLIEKMARAILAATGWGIAEADEVFLGPNYPKMAETFRAYARAAYEAEHEGDVLRDAFAGGTGMARVSLNERGEIASERIAPDAWRAEHEENGK